LECAPTRRGALDLRRTSGAFVWQDESIACRGTKDFSDSRMCFHEKERLCRPAGGTGTSFSFVYPAPMHRGGAKGLTSSCGGLDLLLPAVPTPPSPPWWMDRAANDAKTYFKSAVGGCKTFSPARQCRERGTRMSQSRLRDDRGQAHTSRTDVPHLVRINRIVVRPTDRQRERESRFSRNARNRLGTVK
jgi:hypothetical protein